MKLFKFMTNLLRTSFLYYLFRLCFRWCNICWLYGTNFILQKYFEAWVLYRKSAVWSSILFPFLCVAIPSVIYYNTITSQSWVRFYNESCPCLEVIHNSVYCQKVFISFINCSYIIIPYLTVQFFACYVFLTKWNLIYF